MVESDCSTIRSVRFPLVRPGLRRFAPGAHATRDGQVLIVRGYGGERGWTVVVLVRGEPYPEDEPYPTLRAAARRGRSDYLNGDVMTDTQIWILLVEVGILALAALLWIFRVRP